MKNAILFTILFMLTPFLSMYAQASLTGKIVDKETKEGLISGEIVLYQNDVFITGTTTDFDGKFQLEGIEPGIYMIEAKYLGYKSERITEVVVEEGKSNHISVALKEGGNIILGCGWSRVYKIPLIEMDNTTQGKIISSHMIRSMPIR